MTGVVTLGSLAARAAGLPAGAEVYTIAGLARALEMSVWDVYRRRRVQPDQLPPVVVIDGRTYYPVVSTEAWQPPARQDGRGRWSRSELRARRAAAAAIKAARGAKK